RLEAQAAIVQICEKLEKLARLEADVLFKAKVELLSTEWIQLAGQATPDLHQRYQAALGACEQQLAARAHDIAQAEEKVTLDRQASAFVHTAEDDIQQLIAELYAQD